MGLPIWRAPSPTGSKDAIKVDPTAPARSPIRRRGRGSTPTTAVAGRRVRRSGNAHATLSGTQRSPRLRDSDFVLSASQLRSVDDSTDRHPSHSRSRPPPPPVPESRNYSRPGDLEGTAEPLFSFAEGVDTDSQPQRSIFPSYNPTSSRPTYDGPRRTSSVWEYGIPLFHREYARNTSYTFGDLPTLTPNFAPAGYAAFGRSFRTESPEHQESSSAPSRRHRTSSGWMGARRFAGRTEDAFIIDDGEEDSGDNNAVGFPPFLRMGRRAIADGPLPSSSLRESWSPATTLDGLGDRERSLSPNRERSLSPIDDHWDTMLSTVAPDPLAPTADSSFTSAAASASFSASNVSSRAGSANSNSVSSSHTNLTVPSRQQSRDELFVRVCDTSDDDSPYDTEVEGDDPRPANTRRPRPSPWRRTPLPTDEPLPLMRNPTRYSRSVRDRSLDSNRFVRNYYSSALRTNRETELRSHDLTSPSGDTDGPSLDAELQGARAILERLVSMRGELTDEFWTSIGLTPPLAERVERLQQRDRS